MKDFLLQALDLKNRTLEILDSGILEFPREQNHSFEWHSMLLKLYAEYFRSPARPYHRHHHHYYYVLLQFHFVNKVGNWIFHCLQNHHSSVQDRYFPTFRSESHCLRDLVQRQLLLFPYFLNFSFAFLLQPREEIYYLLSQLCSGLQEGIDISSSHSFSPTLSLYFGVKNHLQNLNLLP